MNKPSKQRDVALSLRMPEELRANIYRAAKASGMSMNSYIIDRLSRSFLLDEMRQMIREEVRAASLAPVKETEVRWPSGVPYIGTPVPGVYRPDQAT